MKTYTKQYAIFSGVLSLLIATTLSAKNINMYEEPKTDAKVLSTIDSANSMIPIFTSKDGEWMKVGDPKNGNVGWIKLSEATTQNDKGAVSTGFTMTEKTISTEKGPQTYRTIQFGAPSAFSQHELDVMTKESLQRQAEIQKYTQKMLQNVFTDVNTFYKQNPDLLNQFSFPMFVPIVVVPESAVKNHPGTLKPEPVLPAKKQ